MTARTTDTRRVNRRKAIPGQDPAIDRLMAICTALAGEVCMLRERLDSQERLLAGAGVFTPGQVDAYDPDDAATAERDTVRQRQIARIFRALRTDLEREETAARRSD